MAASKRRVGLGAFVRVGRWLFEGYGDSDNIPERPEMRAMIHSHSPANDARPRPSILVETGSCCLDQIYPKTRGCNSQRRNSYINNQIIRGNRSSCVG